MGRPQLGLRRDVIEVVLTYVTQAWQVARKREEIDLQTREVDIAGHLVTAIQDLLAAEPSPPNIRFEEEVGTRSIGASRPDGRIDVKVLYTFYPPQAFFGIEFKRVAGSRARLCRKYVREGVLRFVTGKYGSGHDWGALGAFVIDSDVAHAAERLSAEIVGDSATALVRGWEEEVSWGVSCPTYSTRHRQAEQTHEITLLHLMLG